MKREKRVAVLGLGIENLALTNYLLQKGVHVTVCDRRTPEQLGERYTTLHRLGVAFRLGPSYLEGLDDFGVLFRSPGLPLFQPELVDAKRQGVEITSAMRLFVSVCPCPIIGVTGTKGKGTTSALIHRMMVASQRRRGAQSYLGGNIGIAPFSFLPQLSPADVVVLELSSFQLEDMVESVPIAVVTNITEDHLSAVDPDNPNYHRSREAYVLAKTNLFRHQDASGITILNHDDPTCRTLQEMAPGTLLFYGSGAQSPGAWYEKVTDDQYKVFWNLAGEQEELITSDRIKIRGEHNLLNIAAAALAAAQAGADRESIVDAISAYNGLEHRLEYVATVDGIQYFDDSFATAPEPTIVALRAFKEPIVLIAGGVDKGADYRPLAEEILASSVRAVVLIGKMAPVLKELIIRLGAEKGKVPCLVEGGADMATIMAVTQEIAKPGDVVLLSPACASFDLFKNYKERGTLFKRAVMALANKEEDAI
ncbi:MAG: UDP-N-acetylmuramoyl-L-alanine--D-glutamate ligase [Firmicutes bacterium]|nr:UDP-N-acetylmuramoyl-L-alanine--D-glutamate ligase [Bacillota bacterium]